MGEWVVVCLWAVVGLREAMEKGLWVLACLRAGCVDGLGGRWAGSLWGAGGGGIRACGEGGGTPVDGVVIVVALVSDVVGLGVVYCCGESGGARCGVVRDGVLTTGLVCVLESM